MRLLLDSCVSGLVREALERVGHDVSWTGDWPKDPGDEEILSRAHAEKRTDLRGRDYYWMGFVGGRSEPAEGADLHAVYSGRISVTPLHIDLTHHATVHDLKGMVGGPPPRLRRPTGR